MDGVSRSGGKEPGRDIMPFAGVNQCVHGGEEPGIFELRGDSHGHRKIVVPHPGHVQSRHGEDLIQVLERLGRLEQRNHHNVGIGFGKS